MFTVVLLSLIVLFLRGLATGIGHELRQPWTIEKSGDITIHGIFPLRKRSEHHGGLVLNFEGILWMGAAIHRISEINKAGVLPENLTLGYSMKDSCCDADMGLKQSLSVVNKIVNEKSRREFHIPVVISPACHRVEYTSYKLFKMFGLPRVSYTTTSDRFLTYPTEALLRTVPSDLIHVEALVRVLTDMNAREVSVLISRKKLWFERAIAFQTAIKRRPNVALKDVIYFDHVNNLSNILIGCKIIVVFAEENVVKHLMTKRTGTWIAVNRYDDPLFRIFDESGNLSNKTIVRNTRPNDFRSYKIYLDKLSQANNEKNWFGIIVDKYIEQCRNKSFNSEQCTSETFEHNINSYFAGLQKNFRSSLSLQGVVDGIDVVVKAIRNIFKTCKQKSLACLRYSSRNLKWLPFLKNTKLKRDGKLLGFTENGILRANYSIQVLERTVKSIFGRRMMVPKAWTFKKVREWNISEDLSFVYTTKTLSISEPKTTGGMTDYIVEIADNDRILSNNITANNKACLKCGSCNSTVSLLNWTNSWVIGLYLVELLVFCGLIFTLVYFIKHKDSPIMILCCSWPDNVTLIVLCLITLLPIMHIGEQSFVRCLILWPAVNVIFGIYIALLLTKTLCVQNLLKCEVATDHPVRRMIFVLCVTTCHLLIIITSSVISSLVDTRTACISRELVVVCDIKDSTGLIFSTAFNCALLLCLVVLAAQETVKQRKNFCRTENLVAVASVVLVSYVCTIIVGYFNLVVEHYLLITLLHCVLYLVNPIVCLVLIYVPTLRLVSTWLRQHTRQQKNLTSIKRAQVISAKRQSAVPMSDSLFSMNFSPEQSLIPSGQSGYYFDIAPASPAARSSYPSSLIRSVHEPTHVVFGYGRCGHISVDESGGFQTETSMDELDRLSSARSYDSFYDNVAMPSPTRKKTLREQLPREITNYYGKSRDDDVFVNKQCEGNTELSLGETNKWPSLGGLRASDL